MYSSIFTTSLQTVSDQLYMLGVDAGFGLIYEWVLAFKAYLKI